MELLGQFDHEGERRLAIAASEMNLGQRLAER